MKLLRQALESEKQPQEPAETTAQEKAEQAQVCLRGPLAGVYADALNAVYAKQPDSEEAVAVPVEAKEPEKVKAVLESQQMDVTIMQELAKLVNPTNGQAAEIPQDTIYAVSDKGITEDDVVEVVKDLVAAPPGERGEGDFILIVDGTMPGPNGEVAGSEPQESMKRMGVGLEAATIALGGKVFHSVGEYLQTRKH